MSLNSIIYSFLDSTEYSHDHLTQLSLSIFINEYFMLNLLIQCYFIRIEVDTNNEVNIYAES